MCQLFIFRRCPSTIVYYINHCIFLFLPFLSDASSSITIEGTLNSTPNTNFTLEFFANAELDPSGYGEGETFLGSTDVTTDANGDASFMVIF